MWKRCEYFSVSLQINRVLKNAERQLLCKIQSEHFIYLLTYVLSFCDISYVHKVHERAKQREAIVEVDFLTIEVH